MSINVIFKSLRHIGGIFVDYPAHVNNKNVSHKRLHRMNELSFFFEINIDCFVSKNRKIFMVNQLIHFSKLYQHASLFLNTNKSIRVGTNLFPPNFDLPIVTLKCYVVCITLFMVDVYSYTYHLFLLNVHV